jgi:hypothetical protein
MPSKIYPPAIPVPIETSYIGDDQVTWAKVGPGIMSHSGFQINPNNVILNPGPSTNLQVNMCAVFCPIGSIVHFYYSAIVVCLVGPAAFYLLPYVEALPWETGNRAWSMDAAILNTIGCSTFGSFVSWANPVSLIIRGDCAGMPGTQCVVYGQQNQISWWWSKAP